MIPTKQKKIKKGQTTQYTVIIKKIHQSIDQSFLIIRCTDNHK